MGCAPSPMGFAVNLAHGRLRAESAGQKRLICARLFRL